MKHFVFLIDNGNETTEQKISASGMTEAVNRIKELKKNSVKDQQTTFKITFKGVIYENAY
ncbi:hypothetical protein FS935_11275 [Metabacillus litoralis]|uniref:Uncharacterized protein n=1 Tax=Metabacillus litoralis TaxID=152268 RepID=A0A5C6W3W5_9BACI|nr:hypothetical protein [Metabacillus litoralis]TXC90496.1 hypothetical protein FS935_11275 [Metabacillus litoralis]